MIYLIIGVLCAGAAIVLSYLSRWESVIIAYAGMVLTELSGRMALESSTLWFWGGTVLIVLGIYALLPESVRKSKAGMPFFCTGALAGSILGFLLNSVAAVIIGSAAGVLLSSFAFGSLQTGRALGFPTKKYFNYLLAKGLPLVVTYSIIAVSILLAALMPVR